MPVLSLPTPFRFLRGTMISALILGVSACGGQSTEEDSDGDAAADGNGPDSQGSVLDGSSRADVTTDGGSPASDASDASLGPDGTTSTDSGTDARADAARDGSREGAAGDSGSLMCQPQPASNFPAYVGSPRFAQKCTDQQLADFRTQCYGPGTNSGCNAWAAANLDCYNCEGQLASVQPWGMVVGFVFGQAPSYQLNIGGWIQALDPSLTARACAEKMQTHLQCRVQACSSVCPLPGDSATEAEFDAANADLQACLTEANRTTCQASFNDTSCLSSIAPNHPALEPVTRYLTAQDETAATDAYFDTLKVMCGFDHGTRDGGADSGDAASLSCTPQTVPSVPAFIPPPSHSGACTAQQLSEYRTVCFDGNGDCNAWATANPACYACDGDVASAQPWGMVVGFTTGQDVIYKTNVGGWIQALDPAAAPCAQKVQALLQCNIAACGSVCPLPPPSASQSEYDAAEAAQSACIAASNQSTCATYFSASSCASTEAATNPALGALDRYLNATTDGAQIDAYFEVLTAMCGAP